MSERVEERSIDIHPRSLKNGELLPSFSVPFQKQGMYYHKYEEGKLIYPLGYPDNSLIILNSGSAEIFRETRGGRRLIYGEVYHPWVLTNSDSLGVSATRALALTPSSTVAINRKLLPLIFQKEPQFAVWLLDVNAQTVDSLYNLVEFVATKSVRQRYACYLSVHTQAVRDATGTVRYVVKRTSQQQIADRIETSRESVNRAMRRFIGAGVVTIQKRVIIIEDKPMLDSIAEDEE